MKILHILRQKDDAYAWEMAELQGQELETEVIVLLLHDAVFSSPNQSSLKIFACQDDILARGLGGRFPALNYSEIVQLIFDCDTVINW